MQNRYGAVFLFTGDVGGSWNVFVDKYMINGNI